MLPELPEPGPIAAEPLRSVLHGEADNRSPSLIRQLPTSLLLELIGGQTVLKPAEVHIPLDPEMQAPTQVASAGRFTLSNGRLTKWCRSPVVALTSGSLVPEAASECA